MNQTRPNSEDNVDLFFLFKKTNELYKSFLISIYKAIQFLLRNWMVLILLILVGIVLGYFSQKNYEEPKEANVLIRINFNTGRYVYNSVDLLNEKINNQDSIFLKNALLMKGNSSIIKSVEIKPVVDFKKLIENYGPSNRTFEILLDNYDFEENISASENFKYDYDYHTMKISFQPYATSSSIDAVIAYLNKNEILQLVKEEGKKNIQDRIKSNLEIINQINNLIETYTKNKDVGSPVEAIVLDKDISGLIDKKRAIQAQLEIFREQQIVSNDIVVMINKSNLINVKSGMFRNKVVVYPLYLLLFFFILSSFKVLFIKAKELNNKKNNLSSSEC